ncbi:MAG: aminodeoxychorismate synthase component I [Desulfonauticus sp.]|nr:aminodeoxychorismate synthase component I [Desulfonauticus sp.]
MKKKYPTNNFILFESPIFSINNNYLFFNDPIDILIFNPTKSINNFFDQLEKVLSQGFWLAGFFSYEFGYFLNPKLKFLCPLRPTFPLVFLGIFKQPQILVHNDITTSYNNSKPIFQNLKLNLTQQAYEAKIKQIKNYITCGETYQVNFTLKYFFETNAEPVSIYLELRKKQKVSLGGVLKTPEFSIISLSPELFFHIKDQKIYTKPMKGTAPRGINHAHDQEIAHRLANDPKNKAENVMIVDLLRNDLGKICKPGTILVPKLFEVEKYETIHQMTSTITGKLKTLELKQLFEALFPCGSITGAPKIRTMEIIAELENNHRGVYTGAFGFISPQKEMLFNVAIRTLLLQGETGEFGIGSGIVWDSDPQEEFKECLLKAKFLTSPPINFSLVETMKFTPQEGIKLLPLHLKRLTNSAKYFDFPFNKTYTKKILAQNLTRLNNQAKIRLLLSKKGTLKIEIYEFKKLKDVTIGLAKKNFHPPKQFRHHKTTYRPWFAPWQKRASVNNFFDVIFYDENKRLLEGCITNIFLKIKGKLYTPPLYLEILPGVLRESLLKSKQVIEHELTVQDLYLAENIYIGNAVQGLLLVKKFFHLQ